MKINEDRLKIKPENIAQTLFDDIKKYCKTKGIYAASNLSKNFFSFGFDIRFFTDDEFLGFLSIFTDDRGVYKEDADNAIVFQLFSAGNLAKTERKIDAIDIESSYKDIRSMAYKMIDIVASKLSDKKVTNKVDELSSTIRSLSVKELTKYNGVGKMKLNEIKKELQCLTESEINELLSSLSKNEDINQDKPSIPNRGETMSIGDYVGQKELGRVIDQIRNIGFIAWNGGVSKKRIIDYFQDEVYRIIMELR